MRESGRGLVRLGGGDTGVGVGLFEELCIVFEQVWLSGNFAGWGNLAWSCTRQMAHKLDGMYTTTES